MITIWHQMEVYIGLPTQEMDTVKSILDSNGIKYKCRRFGQDSAHFVNSKILSLDFFGLNNHEKIHIIYVHKNDYDKAREVLTNN